IGQRLAPYVKDPIVSVVVREVNSAKFSIVGEVTHPGVYPLRGPVSILQAVALAGGLTEFARKGGIVVFRRGTVAEAQRLALDYDGVVAGKTAGVPTLRAGDTVYVP